jgi:PBSX family phage terminase large subunit
MIFHVAQKEIATDTHRFRVVNCGRRFGKTLLSVYEMVALASGRENGSVAYIAPTHQQARDIAWAELKRVCQPVAQQINETRLEITITNKHGKLSKIALRGWESVETLRGQAFDFIVLDEVSSFRNFWLNWQEVLRPTLTDRRGQCLFISTPKGFNHFYDLYNIELTDQDYKSFHFTTYDNPYIPVDEIEKAKKELTEDRFAQEYMADFRKTEGLVYKEFERGRHVFRGDYKDHMKGQAKIIGGLDFGFTNPAAALTIRKDTDGKYFVTEEWYKRGYTDAQIADYVKALGWNVCYPDPESASGCAELHRRGVNIRDVIKNKDSVRNGINAVRELFKSNRLFIHESCRNLIWELETYTYPEKKPDHNEEENPIKENDHALDALRYALSMEMAQPSTINMIQSQPVRPYYEDLGI